MKFFPFFRMQSRHKLTDSAASAGTKRAQIIGFLFGFFIMGTVSALAGATFSRIKTWVSGETLTASDLNAEFNNILNNLTPAGVDDYSATTTEMRALADPYPGSAESQATSLQGEIERIRYQILEIKKAMQASDVTYWYQDLPTAGVFTIAGSSAGINDTTPDYALDVAGTLGVDHQITASSHVVVTGNITSDGNITTTGDDVDITTHVVITGGLTVSGQSHVVAYSTYTKASAGDQYVNNISSETLDSLSEWNGSTFTATTAGVYQVNACLQLSYSGGGDDSAFMDLRKNGLATSGNFISVSWYRHTGESPDPCVGGAFNLAVGDTISLYLEYTVENPSIIAGSTISILRIL